MYELRSNRIWKDMENRPSRKASHLVHVITHKNKFGDYRWHKEKLNENEHSNGVFCSSKLILWWKTFLSWKILITFLIFKLLLQIKISKYTTYVLFFKLFINYLKSKKPISLIKHGSWNPSTQTERMTSSASKCDNFKMTEAEIQSTSINLIA